MIIDLKKSRSAQFGLDPDYYYSWWARCKACFSVLGDLDFISLLFRQSFMTFCLILSQGFWTLFLLQFWKSIALEKRSSVYPGPWTEKGKLLLFLPRNYFDWKKSFCNKHARVQEKNGHIFLLLLLQLLCIFPLVKMSRAETEKKSSRSREATFTFCVFYAKCKTDFWKVLHSISAKLNCAYSTYYTLA